MKRYIALYTAILLAFSAFSGFYRVEAGSGKLPFEVEIFSDVPENHWAYEPVHYFRFLNITQGIGGNRFGMGQSVKKSEFVAMLVRVMGWELTAEANNSFLDVKKTDWCYPYIETAIQHGAIIKEEESFNPDKPITRLEIAKAIVRSLGYGELAGQLKYLPNQFSDVTEGAEFINMVKDFGISNVNGGTGFLPDATAKKEEAVTMLIRMYQRLNSGINELHAFYAIKSYDQIGMIQNLSSVSFGWSRLQYDNGTGKFTVGVTKGGNSDFFIPEGFREPLDAAKLKGIPGQLNIFASNELKLQNPATGETLGMVEMLLSDAAAQTELIGQVVQTLNGAQAGAEGVVFDGAVIDFENLRGENTRKLYVEFLSKLKLELANNGKRLYVAVHPKRGNGHVYYDGYDYRAIGEIADRVILMAHDYNAVSLTESEMAAGYNDTPLTPISEVYYALKSISDKDAGVADLSKVWLQISFDAVQWKKSGGKVINQSAFRPSYTQLRDRMLKNDPSSNLSVRYSEKLQNPWITYYNDSDGTDNIIWYEDSRSVQAKITLAKMFGIKGISLWRLGNIPDFESTPENGINLDVWQVISRNLK